MGGNALKEFGARRFSKTEYESIRGEVLVKLDTIGPYHGWIEIPSFKDKESFGDLDILCTNINNSTFEKILKSFGNPPNYRNSGTMSLLYKELQVDIISALPNDYHTSLIYYSYNDLGNLMGKIFYKFGLKYGHRGLTLPIRDGDNKFAEIVVSKNSDKIFEFIGLDYARFILRNFYTLEDVFCFVIESPYFSKEIFSFENMNSVARIRYKKRSTYNAFLKYIENIEVKDTVVWIEDTDEYLPTIFSFFPEAYVEYNKVLEDHKVLLARKQKFNGEKALTWLNEVYPGKVLEGKEFGKFMRNFRKGEGDNFDKWVEDTSEENIKNSIISSYKYWVV